MKFINKLFYMLSILTIFNCTLDSNSVDSSTEKMVVNYTIPRINPIISESLNEISQGRAYAISDKIKVTVMQGETIIQESEVSIEEEYDAVGPNEPLSYDLTLYLPIGTGYKMYLESFNLGNSSTIATVIGESDLFDIISGQVTSLSIAMKPNSPKVISAGLEESFTTENYTRFYVDEWNVDPGAEYWFEFTAQSNISAVSFRELVNITQDGETFSEVPCGVIIFNEDGSYVREQEPSDYQKIFKSEVGVRYYICLLPLAYDIGTGIIKKDTINFTVDNYVDTNSSLGSAVPMFFGWNLGMSIGANDNDFFYIHLGVGEYYIENQDYSASVQSSYYEEDLIEINILNEAGSIVSSFPTGVDGFFNIHTSGTYYIQTKSISNSIDTFSTYTIKLNNSSNINLVNSTDGLKEFTTTFNDRKFFEFHREPGKEYFVRLENRYDSGYTAYVDLQPYTIEYDQINNIKKKVNILSYFYSSQPKMYHIDSLDNKTIYALTDIYGEGNFALELEEVNPIVTIETIGSTVVSNSQDGRVHYYVYNVSEGDNLNISCSNSNADISVFTNDKSIFYITNDSYCNENFTIDSGISSIIVRVVHGYGSSSIADFTLEYAP